LISSCATGASSIIFDIGHGMGSFAFKTARTMLANGRATDRTNAAFRARCRHERQIVGRLSLSFFSPCL